MPNIDSRGSVSDLLHRRDSESMESLLNLYRPLIRALAERHLHAGLRGHLDASDIVQETCVEFATSIPNIRTTNRKQFWSYLRVLVLNNVRDAHRRFQMAQKRSMKRESVGQKEQSQWYAWAQRVDSEPLERLVEDENCQRIVEIVQKLPKELQSIIHMRYSQGMTYRFIAECVGRSEDGVRMLILRCLDRIRSEVACDESR